MTVCPAWRKSSACCSMACEEAPRSRISAALPAATCIALYGSRNTLPGERVKVCHRQQLDVFLFRGGKNGCGQRMFALLFQAGNRLQKLRLVNALGGDDGADLRLALGEGSRLIHDQRVHFFHHLQGFRIAHQDSLAGAAARAHHDGHRRRQAQSTRAGNDEHRHGVHQGMRIPRLRTKRPPRPQR